MKVIIIGAGSGVRIGEFAKELPKSLIEVNGKSILEKQISLFKNHHISNIIVITGPYSEKFYIPDLTYIKDKNFHEHDILGSLMEAKEFIKDDVLISYSDILFDKEILEQILNNKSDIAIAVDLDWEKSYIGRTLHPKSEAENVLLDESQNLVQIRKNIQESSTGIVGEFLGILKLSKLGAQIFVEKYEKLFKNHEGGFHNAPSLKKSYLTDMIQELIDSKIVISPIAISGKWCEIDTIQDLENAKKIF